jgi:hypothetical protein
MEAADVSAAAGFQLLKDTVFLKRILLFRKDLETGFFRSE